MIDKGYRPQALAERLIQQRDLTLGVVISGGKKHIGSSQTLNGITAVAEEAGYSLLLKEFPGLDADDVMPIFGALLSYYLDGLIWAIPGKCSNLANGKPVTYAATVAAHDVFRCSNPKIRK